MKVNLSTAFHPQTDVQVECTIQALDDMIRACVIVFKGNRDNNIPIVDFSYNYSYHSSVYMDLFEAFYHKRCLS